MPRHDDDIPAELRRWDGDDWPDDDTTGDSLARAAVVALLALTLFAVWWFATRIL